MKLFQMALPVCSSLRRSSQCVAHPGHPYCVFCSENIFEIAAHIGVCGSFRMLSHWLVGTGSPFSELPTQETIMAALNYLRVREPVGTFLQREM